MLNDHKEHIDEIAQSAVVLYGQNWAALPAWTKERWRETVRHMNRGGMGVNEMEACAGQAIDEWYKSKEMVAAVAVAQPIAEVVEAEASPKQKTKKK